LEIPNVTNPDGGGKGQVVYGGESRVKCEGYGRRRVEERSV